MRNVVGGLLAVLGAAATLISPWQAWYNGRHGSTYKFWEVFGSGVTDSRSGIMDSVFLVFLVTAILTVAGVIVRSRLLVGVAGVIAFGFAILWMVRQGQAAGELTISSGNRGLGAGVAWALVGGLLMISGAVVMTGRPKETVVVDRTRAGTAVAPAAAARAPESNAIPTNPPTPSAPARPVHPAQQGQPAAPTGSTVASSGRPSEAPPASPSGAPPASPSGAPPATGAPSERTGTERLSKEEREMLGLDQDEPSQGKQQK
ncbi:MAG: hypothetical protein HOW97_06310 [Catenulispora sp.]|nr:hypothetical protein [Catenulispora sp.]